MLRTTIGLSFILVLGGAYACSSKSTTDDKGSGGNGAIVGGNSTSGGTTGNGAGTTNVSGGKTSSGGTTGAGTTGGGTGGGAVAGCDGTITCLDANTATACDPATGLVDNFKCVEGYKELGFVSTGCSEDATTGEEGCDVTGVSDAACQTGAQILGRCETATSEELFNIYVNCFQNNNDGHAVITCFNDFGTAATITANQCLQAEEKCFPSAGGAGPVDGAGGAP